MRFFRVEADGSLHCQDADEIDGTTASKLKSTWRAPDFSPAFAKTLRVMKLLVGEAAGVDPITGEGRARARRERMTTSDSKTRTSASGLPRHQQGAAWGCGRARDSG